MLSHGKNSISDTHTTWMNLKGIVLRKEPVSKAYTLDDTVKKDLVWGGWHRWGLGDGLTTKGQFEGIFRVRKLFRLLIVAMWHGHMDIYIVKAQKTTHLNTKLILLNINLKITLKTPWGTCFSLGSPKNTEIRHWGLGIGLQSESRNRKWRNEKSETEKGEKFFVVV